MPPALSYNNDLLGRTIRNLEQAQGFTRHHNTARDILQASASERSETTSASLDIMDDAASETSEAAVRTETPPSGAATATLTTNLNESTALLRNLRARNTILAADLARIADSLARYEEVSTKALSKLKRSKARWTVAFLCSSCLWMLYLWWCWSMRVEFEYIRKRRGEILGI